MVSCAACGQRVALGRRRYLCRMARVQTLVAQLDLARHEAEKDVAETPPEVRSALLEVRPLLEGLLAEGRGHAVDLHEAAHHRAFAVDDDRVRTWESTAERVLFELLAALELHPD